MKYKILLMPVLLLASCMPDKEEKHIEDIALQFARQYFECHYHEAMQMCTPESEKWIKFVATNISDSDLAVLNNATTAPEYSITDLTYIDDSTVQVKVEASHYLYAHHIGEKGTIKNNSIYPFVMKHINGEWRIDLRSIPKEEKE